MSNAMPDRKVPIKDELGNEIGEVIAAEFDEKTQTILFTGRMNDGMQFKASQEIGISFGPGGITAFDKEK